MDGRCYPYHSDSNLFNKLRPEHDCSTTVKGLKQTNKQKYIQHSWKGLCKYSPFIGTLETWPSFKLLNIIQVFYTRLEIIWRFNFCKFRQFNQYSKKMQIGSYATCISFCYFNYRDSLISLNLFWFLKISSLHETCSEVNANINIVIFTLILHQLIYTVNPTL